MYRCQRYYAHKSNKVHNIVFFYYEPSIKIIQMGETLMCKNHQGGRLRDEVDAERINL